MKKAKLITLLGGVSSILAVAPMISAGCNSSHPKAPKQNVANIMRNDNFKLDGEKLQNAPKIVMVTDGGDINDKSFNQSAWEAVIAYGEQNNLDYSSYDVIEVKNDEYEKAYGAALETGATIWVLPGWMHSSHIESFAKQNKDNEDFKKVTLITVDFTLEKSTNVNPGSSIGILFNTKEGGFLAGYAAGEYLSQEKEPNDRTFTTFGGSDFFGVTDFNEGFYKGILEWNEKHTNAKVHATEQSVNIDSGFNAGDSKMTSAVNTAVTSGAKLILPVAGPATYVVTNNQTYKDTNKLVIGVDTDQALATPSGKDTFFTSILKKIGQATYDVIGSLTSGKSTNEILGNFVKGKTNETIKKGVSENWVGLSETYIAGENQKRAETAIQNALEYWKQLSEDTKNYLYSTKATKNGADVTNIQDRLNQLSAETKK